MSQRATYLQAHPSALQQQSFTGGAELAAKAAREREFARQISPEHYVPKPVTEKEAKAFFRSPYGKLFKQTVDEREQVEANIVKLCAIRECINELPGYDRMDMEFDRVVQDARRQRLFPLLERLTRLHILQKCDPDGRLYSVLRIQEHPDRMDMLLQLAWQGEGAVDQARRQLLDLERLSAKGIIAQAFGERLGRVIGGAEIIERVMLMSIHCECRCGRIFYPYSPFAADVVNLTEAASKLLEEEANAEGAAGQAEDIATSEEDEAGE